tara:strand:+ start:36 stop:863 length:828 start_codon:yes stop_codon:yes gene_type:complete
MFDASDLPESQFLDFFTDLVRDLVDEQNHQDWMRLGFDSQSYHRGISAALKKILAKPYGLHTLRVNASKIYRLWTEHIWCHILELAFVMAILFDRVWVEPTQLEEDEWERDGQFSVNSWHARVDAYHRDTAFLYQLKESVKYVCLSGADHLERHSGSINALNEQAIQDTDHHCPGIFDCLMCRFSRFKRSIAMNLRHRMWPMFIDLRDESSSDDDSASLSQDASATSEVDEETSTQTAIMNTQDALERLVSEGHCNEFAYKTMYDHLLVIYKASA